MLKYKALYKKMNDDLKDSGMWLEWAKELMGKDDEVANFLYQSAKERIEDGFPKTYELFKHTCETDKAKDGHCMNEMVEDQFMEWHEELEHKLKTF